MKKYFLLIPAIVCALFCTLFLAACVFDDLLDDENYNTGENSVPGNSDHEEVADSDKIVVQNYNDEIHYSFFYCAEENCPDGNVDNALLHGEMECNVGETYFVVLDFTLDSFQKWNDQDKFSVSVQFSPVDAVDVRLEEAATGDIEENITKSEHTVTATYKIPEAKNEARSYRIVFRLTLKQRECLSFGVAFHSETELPSYQMTTVDQQRTLELRYSLNSDGKSYSVSGLDSTSDQTIYIPQTHKSLPVTAIDKGVFRGQRKFTAVVISPNIESIDEGAFEECDNLKEVEFKYSDDDVSHLTTVGARAFARCTALEELSLPDKVTSIGESAFADCVNIKELSLPDKVTSIGDSAFAGCINLKELYLPSKVTSIGDRAFNGITARLYIPDNSITEVGKELFDGYTGTELEIPDGVSSIAPGALATCGCLEKLSLPSLTLYDEQDEPRNDPESGYFRHFLGEGNAYFCALFKSFEDQTDFLPLLLRSVEIDRCNFIDDYAFYGCKGLENFYSQYVSYIGDYAFAECSGLSNFSSRHYQNDYGVTCGIGAHAFENCAAMRSFTLYFSSLSKSEEIEESAFRGCTALTNLKLYFESTYQEWEIAAGAFEDCPELKSVTISVASNRGEDINYIRSSELQDPANAEEPIVLSQDELMNPELLARYLTQDYLNCNWKIVIEWQS